MSIARRNRLLAGVAVVLVVVGVVLIIAGRATQEHAPQPPASAAGTYAAAAPDPTSPPGTGAASPSPPTIVSPTIRGPILAASRPVRLTIPKIHVNDTLIGLGINRDRTVQVPPLSAHSQPGWYRYSPTPGSLGPAIILGHVDSARYGAGVFFELGALRKGDTVEVTRADHTVAVFRVDAVASYPKDHFPTLTVYGNTDHAALRLITCGGDFDSSSGNYRNNIVAFASLVGTRRA